MKLFVFLLISILLSFANCSVSDNDTDPKSDDISELYNFPYSVSIQSPGHRGRRHACGGAILNKRWILTAASCITFEDPHAFHIRAAFSPYDHSLERQTRNYVAIEYILHPDFVAEEKYSDYNVALMKIDSDIIFADEVQPVSLSSSSLGAESHVSGMIAGWRNIDYHTQEVRPPIKLDTIGQVACAEEREFVITDNMICAKEVDGGQTADITQCDSIAGSPFIVNKKMVGIAAWDVGCNVDGVRAGPAILVNLTDDIKSWISENTKL